VTISRTQGDNGTGCLTLAENSSNGGSASLVFGGTKDTFGTFQVINDILVATIQSEGGTGQNAGLVFIGSPAAARSAQAYSTKSTAVKRSSRAP
jgi:hypothetical protein